MVKTPSGSLKLPMQKGMWNEEEDEQITTYASKQGKGLLGGMRRSGKSSRQRWNSNEKKPADPKHKSFTPQEEELVIKLHAAIGSRWPIIAQQLSGRSENDVKVLWNSKLRKKLSAMGIDPVTHRPFSQILADYGNIGAFPKTRTTTTTTTRFSTSLSRDLKNAVMLNNSEQFSPLNFSMPGSNVPTSNVELISDHQNQNSIDLYSQLQAINLVTEAASNHAAAKTDQSVTPNFMTDQCALSSDYNNNAMVNHHHEVSSFSWSDFLLEDAFLPKNNVDLEQDSSFGMVLQNDHDEENGSDEALMLVVDNNRFEASTSSSNGSFVEAMLEGQQDHEMFPHFVSADFDDNEEPFYY